MATTKTTTTKKTTKPAARRTVKVTPKTAADTATEAADGTVAEMPETAGTSEKRGDLRMRAYLTAVTERSGLKRRDAKKAIEAALAVLGEAVADGRGVNLPGLGKVKVVKTKKQTNASLFVLRLRQAEAADGGTDGPAPEPEDKDPLAEAAE